MSHAREIGLRAAYIAISAGLAFVAFGTGWHAALFGIFAFSTSSIGLYLQLVVRQIRRLKSRKIAGPRSHGREILNRSILVAVGGYAGYMAFGTVAHACLFAWLMLGTAFLDFYLRLVLRDLLTLPDDAWGN